MNDTPASEQQASNTLDRARVGHLPGRCTYCGFHIATQRHRDGCKAPARPPDQHRATNTPPPTESIRIARKTALRVKTTRREQRNAYRAAGGPTPPLPTGRGFIDTCRNDDDAVTLILAGAPPELFEWTDPPTARSLRHNATAAARWAVIKPPPKPKRRNHNPAVLGATEKGMAALRDESEILENTSGGQRNHQLNTSAFNLGQLVASGDLPESVVVAELRAVARHIGLTEREVNGSNGDSGTLHSGLNKGKANPRNR